MVRKMSSQVANAYEIIHKRIISYEMPPEAPVSDNQLAKELGMSRAPVREAILLLVMDGLMQTSADGKMVVSPIRLDDVVDILHVRRALESEALALIAVRGWLRAPERKTLREIHEKLCGALAPGNIPEHYQYDDQFHAALVGFCGSSRITEILEQMRLQMQRARWLNLAVPTRQPATVAEHGLLLDAILAQDLDGATAALTLHFQNSEQAFRDILSDERMRQIAMTMGNFFGEQ